MQLTDAIDRYTEALAQRFDVGESVQVSAGWVDEHDGATGEVVAAYPTGYVVRFGGDPASDTFYFAEQLRRLEAADSG